MDKRGISAVVATVLIILITVAGVTIIWAVILPMIRESMEFEMADVSIVSSEGYSVYDSSLNISCIQVKRTPDEFNLSAVQVIFSIKGTSYSCFVAPPPDTNQVITYCFNFSGFDEPDAVSVAPVLRKGRTVKLGQVTSELESIPAGNLIGFTVGSMTLMSNCSTDKNPDLLPECISECSAGEKECVGTGGYRECVSVGTCWKWSSDIGCDSGEECQGGNCVSANSCMHEYFASWNGNQWIVNQYDLPYCDPSCTPLDWNGPTARGYLKRVCGMSCSNNQVCNGETLSPEVPNWNPNSCESFFGGCSYYPTSTATVVINAEGINRVLGYQDSMGGFSRIWADSEKGILADDQAIYDGRANHKWSLMIKTGPSSWISTDSSTTSSGGCGGFSGNMSLTFSDGSTRAVPVTITINNNPC